MTSIAPISDLQQIRSFESKYCKKEQKSDYFKIFSHYVQSSQGTYRLFKVLSEAVRWSIYFARTISLSPEFIKKLIAIQGNFRFLSNNLILAKYPQTLFELNSSYDAYQKAQIQDITRKRDKLASKVVEVISETSFLIQLGEFLSLYTLGALGSVVNLTGNLFNLFFNCFCLKMGSENYFEHERMQKIVEGQKTPITRLQSLFHEIKNLDLLNIAKSITSIALTTFFISDILFKTTIISAGCLLFLSTTVTVLAIWSHFYKESMTFPLGD